MKQTLVQISNMIEVLSSIQTDNFKINYWISRNMKNLEDSYTFMYEQRNKIYQEYLVQDDKNSFVTLLKNGDCKFNFKEETPDFIAQFSEKMNALFNLECDVNAYMIDVQTLIEQNISLTPAQITYITPLLSEE